MKNIRRFLLCLLSLPFMVSVSCDDGNTGVSSGDGKGEDGLPFDEPLEQTFNYCPSVIEEEDGTRYVFYCSTAVSGVIQDHIFCRKGTRRENGSYEWSEKTLVLAPRYFSEYFDAFHCCDPCVIKGDFLYNGQRYRYLMAYTGNTSSVNNKVGIAVSDSLMEGWIALEEPLITYSGDPSHWGVGQPTLLSADKKGEVLLVYSVGGNSTYNVVERWDFSDLNEPVRLSSDKVTEKGLTSLNGGLDYLSNTDIAFDEKTSRFYVVSDCHPNPTDGEPFFVGSHFRVTYLSEKEETLGASLAQAGGRSWMSLATVGPAETGFPRNSNCAIVRDAYGRVGGDEIEVFYSMSRTGDGYAWTYRIYAYKIPVRE